VPVSFGGHGGELGGFDFHQWSQTIAQSTNTLSKMFFVVSTTLPL
jgi:hypothetical protein